MNTSEGRIQEQSRQKLMVVCCCLPDEIDHSTLQEFRLRRLINKVKLSTHLALQSRDEHAYWCAFENSREQGVDADGHAWLHLLTKKT